MIRNAALLSILLAAPVVAAAEPPNPMATPPPTPGPKKINTDLKVAPGILLARPKPAACPGAQSTAILLSSCSGGPGTHLTLMLESNVTPVGVLFKQNAGSKVANYSATVGRSAGAYTVTVPPLCNGGSPSFSLVVSYIPLVLGRGSVSKNLGNFTALCGQTAQATASPKPTPTATQATASPSTGIVCPGTQYATGPHFLFSSCSGAPGKQVTLTGAPPNMGNAQLQSSSNGFSLGIDVGPRNVSAGPYTFIVPQSACNGWSGNRSLPLTLTYLIAPNPGNYQSMVGYFTFICPQTAPTASPKPTPTSTYTPTPYYTINPF